jgi:uncharacterized protein with HEPN domain
MTPHWLAHAIYILNTIEILERAVAEDFAYLSSNELVYRGTIQALQTLAESAHKLPEDIKQAHPEITWNEFRIMRNFFAHDYLTAPTNVRILEIISHDLPPLKQALLQHIPNWDEIKNDYPYKPG